jgi:tol-pal system protein YbgF
MAVPSTPSVPAPRAAIPPVITPPPAAAPPARPAPPSTPAPAPAAATRPAAVAAIPPPAPETRRPVESPEAQQLYQSAYIDFSKGNYALAVTGFKEFLRRYPEHELADNAQYWVAEAHLSLARNHADANQPDKEAQALQQAVQEFRRVVANHPRGDKAPTALYKEALALIQLRQPQVAQSRLQYLVDNFPQAEETPLARERLAALKDR